LWCNSREDYDKKSQQRAKLMKEEIITLTLAETVEGKYTFPEHLAHMIKAGVFGYIIDLINKTAQYYDELNRTYVIPFPYKPDFKVSDTWTPEGLKKALLDIQNKKISYIEFLHEIAHAGIALYDVQMEASQTVYYAKAKRASYIERFPIQVCDFIAKQRSS
jgi:uncharacterized protein YbcV (DUF1398 family)